METMTSLGSCREYANKSNSTDSQIIRGNSFISKWDCFPLSLFGSRALQSSFWKFFWPSSPIQLPSWIANTSLSLRTFPSISAEDCIASKTEVKPSLSVFSLNWCAYSQPLPASSCTGKPWNPSTLASFVEVHIHSFEVQQSNKPFQCYATYFDVIWDIQQHDSPFFYRCSEQIMLFTTFLNTLRFSQFSTVSTFFVCFGSQETYWTRWGEGLQSVTKIQYQKEINSFNPEQSRGQTPFFPPLSLCPNLSSMIQRFSFHFL